MSFTIFISGILPATLRFSKKHRYNVVVIRIAFILVGLIVAFALGVYVGSPRASPQLESTTEEVPTATTTSVRSNASPRYPVIKVIDGDTLVVLMDGKNVTIRLIGIDTPETVDPRKPVQCFGKEASEKAKQVLSGSTVLLETDPSQGELDKYGRVLAYAFLENGLNVAEYLIVEGYGHEYTYNLPYKYQGDFKEAEEKARTEKRGLWADDACIESGVSGQVSAVSNAAQNAGYECARNAYNCSDFSTHAEAQAAFDACGGATNDIHKLDSDSDGEVCESLP